MYNPKDECRKITERISKMFELRGYSCYTAAKKAKISTSTMYNIINGKTMPQIFTLFVLCNVLQVSIIDIFDDTTFGNIKENNGMNPLNVEMIKLSDDEKNLLRCYRQIPEKQREWLKTCISLVSRAECDKG